MEGYELEDDKIPVFLINGFLEAGENAVSAVYHVSGLFSDGRKDLADCLRRRRK